ncbi:hypothetical protein TNCV_4035821 [Trichonephila clavipes]|nr:hypothetical protein TNCV_4035821 [Trichonephila clavipes]
MIDFFEFRLQREGCDVIPSLCLLSGTEVHCALRLVWGGRRCGFVLRNQWEERRFSTAVKELACELRCLDLTDPITKCRNKENHITEEANIKASPRTARTLKDTFTVFRKHAKKPTAHLLLLTLKVEHQQFIKYMEMEERS